MSASRQAVEAPVLYIERTAEKPYAYEYPPPAGKPVRSAEYREHRVLIQNARALRTAPTLDRQGFELREHVSKVRDFYDPEQVRTIYYPELERLVQSATGASSAVVFDHTVRAADPVRQAGRLVQPPVGRVHNDYTPESAVRRLRQVVPGERADELLKHRFVEINVWRPIRGPLQTQPLAVIDASSVANEDFIACDLLYPDRKGEIYYVAHGPRHQWYYFPDMVRDEALLIKGFDSDASRARFAAHASFENPHAPTDAAPRESIEARIFAFFAPGRAPALGKFLIQFR